MLINIVVPIRELQKRNRKDEKAQMAMFSALWVPWRTSVSLPSRRTRSISPLSLRPPSTSLSVSAVPYYFNFPVFVSPGRTVRTQHFFFSGRWYHSRLDLAPSISPLVLSTNKDIQVTFLSQSDLTTSRPLRPRWRTNPTLPDPDFRLAYDWRYNVIVIPFGKFISVF